MADSESPIVWAERLCKSYRLRGTVVEALRGVDLAIQPGEFVAIMGPSGSGKSTLLNLLGGLDEPSSGAVYIAGVQLGRLREEARASLRRRQIGFVFQSYELLPLLNVGQNVEFPLAVAGLPAPVRRRQAEEALAEVGLTAKLEAMPDELSGGEKQRVAIARALVSRPQVIFADEPTGSLDSLTAGAVTALLRAAVRQRGTTVVMVTHDEGDAHRADRILRLCDGRLAGELAAC